MNAGLTYTVKHIQKGLLTHLASSIFWPTIWQKTSSRTNQNSFSNFSLSNNLSTGERIFGTIHVSRKVAVAAEAGL